LVPHPSCGGVLTVGSSVAQPLPEQSASAAPVPITSAKADIAANIASRFMVGPFPSK
jgi:hypothetical protein